MGMQAVEGASGGGIYLDNGLCCAPKDDEYENLGIFASTPFKHV